MTLSLAIQLKDSEHKLHMYVMTIGSSCFKRSHYHLIKANLSKKKKKKRNSMARHYTPFQEGAVKHRETSEQIVQSTPSELDHHPLNRKPVAPRLDWQRSPPQQPQLARGLPGVVIRFECYTGGQTLLSCRHNRSAAPACLYEDSRCVCGKLLVSSR